jgi:hypothetical protein
VERNNLGAENDSEETLEAAVPNRGFSSVDEFQVRICRIFGGSPMKPENQLADAAVEWRRAELKFKEAEKTWFRVSGVSGDAPKNLQKQESANVKMWQRFRIKEGAEARVAMLADILIEQEDRT